MKLTRLVMAVVACGSLVASSCSRKPDAASASERAGAPARSRTLKIEIASPDATDIPRLIAIDALRARGYQVDTVELANNSLLFVAMQKGDVDLAAAADLTGWNAIHQGAPAFELMDESRMTILFLAADGIRTCADLDGKPIATGTAGGAYATLTRAYLDKECPDAKPRAVIVPGAPNRVAALISGEVVATPVELYDYLQMPPADAKRFHTLVSFADEFPDLTSISLFMRRGLAAEFPESAKDLVREILQARRRIQDPDVLSNELTSRLRLSPAMARSTAEEFLKRHVWNVNGMSLQSIENNMDFYRKRNLLPPALAVRDVADLSYLNSVLDEIGRQ